MPNFEYKGRSIRLTPGQGDDGRWACQFIILESGDTSSGSITGDTDGYFSSAAQAEAAAFKKAQLIIDTN